MCSYKQQVQTCVSPWQASAVFPLALQVPVVQAAYNTPSSCLPLFALLFALLPIPC
jgi:hypothetical protein